MNQLNPISIKEREVDVEQYLRRQCAARNWDCEKLNPTNKRGLQDRMILPGEGLVYFVELKREKGPIKPLQSRRLRQMCERGYQAFIIEGCEEVDHLIRHIENVVRS
jgi:hypothetical protein